MTEKVELRPAFAWDCPECCVENFTRGIVVEKSPEEMAEMPSSVTCRRHDCHKTFETIHFSEDQ